MQKIQKMQCLLLVLIMEHVAYATYGCRASDRSTAVEILDCLAAIGSLRCSDEPVVSALQGLCQS